VNKPMNFHNMFSARPSDLANFATDQNFMLYNSHYNIKLIANFRRTPTLR